MSTPSPDERLAADLRHTIRDVPDFPRPGIVFKDITPVLSDAALFRRCVDALASKFAGQGITHVLAIESRGFLLGAPVAVSLAAALVPLRKPGKLPYRRVTEAYQLEYGRDALEMHVDALGPGSRVIVIDDVLATGGTAAAACRLAEGRGATICGIGVMVDLSFLPWRTALAGRVAHALVSF